MKIGFVGLGKIGLSLAETMAKEHQVVGFDIAPRSSRHIRVVKDVADAVQGMDLVLVVVSTPHDKRYDGSAPALHLEPKGFDCSHLQQALKSVSDVVAPGQCVVVVSTVLPGTTRRELAPLIPGVRLLHCPSFVAVGTVESDFLRGDLQIIGSCQGKREECEDWISLLQSFNPESNPTVGTWEEAETTKLLHNGFINFKISMVNLAQDIAMSVGHCNVDVVSEGLCKAKDRLWSPLYMKAGMGDGGPCHPRDLIALSYLAGKLDLGYDLFGALSACREGQAQNLARFLLDLQRPVLFTTRAYKPGVELDDGSNALLVAAFVRQMGQQTAFCDDFESPPSGSWTVLLVHDVDHRGWSFPEGAIIVDPWRRYHSESHRVVHYGDSRSA